ncbi:M15 family metallopeptidase [Paeniglutamicibacter antarcticus]|uniref:M15 family metallopeptidase n=1 Tax=Arthrobacter terrae TaxID=2935737 RepID=A0A931CNI7_9MICC|nr:M15 family metallopeptidase [Arthrobacter terrae]MBG0738649.1 M15 family metallopeptidase [Arthrobacter terrae]
MNHVLHVTADMLPYTYRGGCPVPVSDLKAVIFDHLGFDGAVHEGTIIVHRAIAGSLLEGLAAALELGFPIQQAVPVDDDAYRGDDHASMAANNSSGFNYRTIAGTTRVSMHSLGLAVDINPLLNPYLARDGSWYPEATHIERVDRPGALTASHHLTKTLTGLGFEWGGSWARPDYHHFEWAEPLGR